MPQQEETHLRWTQPSWRAEAERWIRNRVDELGRELIKLEQPHVRPWGTVYRIETDAGTVWFKAPIAPLAYEASLLDQVATRRPDAVPRLLAADDSPGWMLIADAGTQLPDLYPDGVPVELWEEFLPTYAQLQLDAAPAAGALLAAGVPDRRSHHLVDGYLRVLDDDGRYRFIDWGDASIAQPLLSLYVPLVRVPENDIARARDAYLEPWAALSPRAELVAACDAALLLAQLTGTLKWELISAALTDEERGDYANVIPKRLRYLLELACA